MVARDPHPHEVFVRIVRSEVVESSPDHGVVDGARTSPDGLPAARLLGVSQQPAPRTLKSTTLVGYLLSEGSRLLSRSEPDLHSDEVRDSRVRFSFSRADGFAACAVSGGDAVGVAIESVRRIGADPLSVSAGVCSREERSLLAATSPLGRPWRLLVMWTMKEAIAKAVGLGASFSLQRITVGDTSGISTRMLDSLGGPVPSEWHFATWRPTPIHVVAVAVRSTPGTRVRFGGDLTGTPHGVSANGTHLSSAADPLQVDAWRVSPQA